MADAVYDAETGKLHLKNEAGEDITIAEGIASKEAVEKNTSDIKGEGHAAPVFQNLPESVHFQYTSDFPVASARRVMGKLPKPAKRPGRSHE